MRCSVFPAFKNKRFSLGNTMVRGLNYVDVNVCELDHRQRDLCRFEPVRTLPLLTPGRERSYFYLNVWHFYAPESYPAQLPIPKCLALLPTQSRSHTRTTLMSDTPTQHTSYPTQLLPKHPQSSILAFANFYSDICKVLFRHSPTSILTFAEF